MDHQARQHRHQIAIQSSLSPPVERVHLQDHNGAITSNEKEILDNHWTTFRVEQYYSTRWNTTSLHLLTLDWQLYYKNYQRASATKQIYIIKLLTGWLPVNHRLNKMMTTKLYCPNCENEETIGHIFQCPGRHSWRQQFFKNSQLVLQKYQTPPELSQEVTEHINSILTTMLVTTEFQQYTIFAGLLPTKWTNSKHLNNSHKGASLNTSARRAAKLCYWLTQQGHDVWIARNKQIHKEKLATATHEYLNTKIHQLYKLQNEINYHDSELFSQPIEERINLTEKQKMTWLAQTTTTMKISMEEFRNKQKRGQKDTWQFFTKRKKSQ